MRNPWRARPVAKRQPIARRRLLRFEGLESRELLATLFVATSGSDAGAGTADSPFRNIQRAVTAALSGDEIRVATGTYFYDPSAEVIDAKRNLTYTKVMSTTAVVSTYNKQLAILGGFATTDWAVPDPQTHPTIIDGQGRYRGVMALGLAAPTGLRLEGFTIANGLATGIAARGGSSAVYGFGGGLFVDMGGRQSDASAYVLRDLVFQNNTAVASGALGSEGGRAAGGGVALRYVQSATLERVTFVANTAQGTDGAEAGGGGLGGALHVDHSRVVGSDLIFRDNVARSGNSSGSGRGGQTREKADGLGGAVAIQQSSSATLSRVTATNNQAYGGNARTEGGDAYGGAFFLEFGDTSLTLTDSFLQGNRAVAGNASTGGNVGGGAVMSQNSSVTIERSRIVGNSVVGGSATGGGSAGGGGGGGIYVARFQDGATFALTSSVVADNTVSAGQGGGSPGGGGGGIFIQGMNSTLTNVTLDNNRLDSRLALGQSLLLVAGGAAPAAVTLSNSIISNNRGPRLEGGAIDANSASAGTVTFARNLNFNNDALVGGNGSLNVAGASSNLTVRPAPNLAGLYNAPGSPRWDYHLVRSQANPAIDAGVAGAAALDLDGNPRSGAPDLGAAEAIAPRYEFVGQPRASEGSPLRIVVARRGDISVAGSVEVALVPGGTAREGVDYAPFGNGGVVVVNFAPYEETATVVLSTLSVAGIQAADRTVVLALRLSSSDGNSRLGNPAAITASIVDRDAFPQGSGFGVVGIDLLRRAKGVTGVIVRFNAKLSPATLRKGVAKAFALRKVSGKGKAPGILAARYNKATGAVTVRFSGPVRPGRVVLLVLKGPKLKDVSGRSLAPTTFLITG